MPTAKMHIHEVETSPDLVRRLLAAQFPHWADLPIHPIASAGTDNAIYRLGDAHSVRLPRIDWATGQAQKERTWLPKLAPHLPLAVPEQLAMGEPGEGYPWNWSVYRWLPGENLTHTGIADPTEAACDLASFILALQQIDTTNGPPAAGSQSRGAPLSTRDTATRDAITALQPQIDTKTVLEIWEIALQAPEWVREPTWFHADLLPGNLLFTDGKLSAVIDFSGLGIGDPACDLMIAWALFSGESRAAFRDALGVNDATWARGRGHALSQALIFIPYYLNTNPVGVAYARHTLAEILTEYQEESRR